MAEITKQYTYRIPDTYFGDTWEQKKTASAMYTGPAEGFVFVKKDTGLLVFDESFHVIEAAGELTAEEVEAMLQEDLGTRCDASETLVKVSAPNSNEETIIAAAMQGIDISGWPDKEYAFPEGHANAGEVYHVDSDPQPISDVLDIEHGIKYDFDTKTWSLDDVAFLNPFCTEEQHTAALTNQKEAAIRLKEETGRNWTDAQIAEIDRFVAECDAVPSKFAGIHWLMIKFPILNSDILFPEPTPDEDAEAE